MHFEKNNPRRTWAVGLTLAMLVSQTTFADTYNFFFSKPKKNPTQSVAPATNPAEEPNNEATEEESKPSVEEAPKSTPTAQAPIVIHNINNIGTRPEAAPSPSPSPASPSALSTEVSAKVLSRIPDNNWQMGMGALFIREGVAASVGGMLSLAYIPATSYFGLTFFAGARHVGITGADQVSVNKLELGGDLNWLPIRWNGRSGVDFGLLLGASSMAAAPGNIGSLHAGLRLNVHLGKDFGLGFVTRANKGFTSLEAGLLIEL